MTADEVGYELLVQMGFLTGLLKDAFEIVEQLEGRFAHEPQYVVAGVFGGHLESAADVLGNEFAGVLAIDFVDTLIACVV